MSLEKKCGVILLSVLSLFWIPAHSQTVKILFDARKAEAAGNADWVIDADAHNLGFGSGPAVLNGGNESNAQRVPTPAQSGITVSTSETFWNGALSYWAIDCVRENYFVETLPYNSQITYGNSSNAQDLSNYKVYIVCEPNILYTAAEKTAILNFVQNGGGLFMISDHDVSDRNNDGKDSPFIWNDLMSNNAVQVNPFGISFDYANFSQTSSNIPNLPSDSILNGPAGNVTQVQWNNGTSITLTPAQNSSVKGVVYKTGSSFGNSNVLCAYARYGNGKVAAFGDSSPCDDGTGDPNDNLYPGYAQDANGNHRKLLMNITIWLAAANSASPPVADFIVEPVITCVGQSATFTNNSSSGINTFSWNFGAGASPATANTIGPHSVSYTNAGAKTISLTVSNTNGSNTLTKTNYVTVNSSCVTKDIGVLSLLDPDVATCPVLDNPLQVRIKNYGSSIINFSIDPTTVFIKISDPNSIVQSFSKTINTGSLSAGATLDVLFNNTYNLDLSGNYIFNSYTVFAPDANSSNDSMLTTLVNVLPGFQYDYTVLSENLGTVSSTTSIANHELNNGFQNDSLTMSGTADVRVTQTSLSYYTGASGGANVFFTNSAGRYFTIAGINTSNLQNLELSFGLYKNNTSTTVSDFKVQVSVDGTLFTDLSLPVLPSGAAWNYVKVSGAIPSTPNLFLRFLQNASTYQYRVDDILLLEKISSPVITASQSTVFCQGDSVLLTASPATDYLWSNGSTSQMISVTTSGSFYVIETNASGCEDSSGAIQVTVNPQYTFIRNRFIAQGSSYTLPGGQVVSTSGNYFSNFLTNAGCDSVIQTNLTLVNVDDNNMCTIDACDSITGSVSHIAVNPDDGDPCTIDGCNPLTGIFHTPVLEICGNGIDDNCNGQIDEGCSVNLNLKVFFEGFYIGGSEMKATVNPISYPVLCDTVSVLLKQTSSPYSTLFTLKSTVDKNGNGTFITPSGVRGQSYYIVVLHRGSLETWSAAPVLLNDSLVNYDFTNVISKAFANSLKSVGNGNFAVYSGDINQDGIINQVDVSAIESKFPLFSVGYLNEDLNGDGIIESVDCGILENNYGRIVLKP